MPESYPSALAGWLEAYLVHRLGRQMKKGSWPTELRRLGRVAQRHGVERFEDLTPSMLEEFLSDSHPAPRTRNERLSKLGVLQRFLAPRGVDLAIPDGLSVPTPGFLPHLFTLQELGSLLAVFREKGSRDPFRWLGLRTLLFLLYACGMRSSEPVGLRVCDLDLERSALFLRCTKFYKQRWVPLGSAARRLVVEYAEARRLRRPESHPEEPFFILRGDGRPIRAWLLRATFAAALGQLGIVSRGTRRPRLHDLRHTMAVHRLYNWYSEGIDVQNKLPLLSAYLGHDCIHDTEAYLHLAEDLIRLAGRNFQRSFDQVVGPLVAQ